VPASKILLRLDPASVDLTRPEVHPQPYGWPLAWTRSYGAGRVFYTALGHEEGVWRDARFQRVMRNAARWAIGNRRRTGARWAIGNRRRTGNVCDSSRREGGISRHRRRGPVHVHAVVAARRRAADAIS
jgi:hypothetical protein